MADFELNAQVRTDHGKAAARRMRRIEDKIPAVIYGAGKEAVSITLEHKDVLYALKNEAVFSHILKIKLDDGQEEQVVLKDLQRHVFKPKVKHVDFLRINVKEKITMHVPLHFVGEENSPGVKAGGMLSKMMTDVEIKCLPTNLPEFLELDISGLELDQTLHMTDIKLPAGVEHSHEIDEEHNHSVVSVHAPKAAEEPEAEAAAEAASDEAKADDAEKAADSAEKTEE